MGNKRALQAVDKMKEVREGKNKCEGRTQMRNEIYLQCIIYLEISLNYWWDINDILIRYIFYMFEIWLKY